MPRSGPIAEVLSSRAEWLDALAHGSVAARRQALDDLADDGRTEDRIRQGYTGRAAIELLQNAHDAMVDSHTVGDVRFIVTERALLVANQGQPFDAERVRSLTRLGSSSKAVRRAEHHLIGYKGIGFTSVFEVSDRPEVLSLDVGFGFDRAAAAELVEASLGDGLDGPVPARYFPLPLAPDDLGSDEALVASLFDAGAVTVVRLPFREDADREAILANVHETLTPETLLFMPTIRTLSLEEPSGRFEWLRRPGSRTGVGRIIHLERPGGERLSWLLARTTTPVERDLVAALDDELWADVRRLNVAVAIPWSDRGPSPDPRPTRIHSYFPTDDQLGRGVLTHADFYLNSTRRGLELKGAGGAVTRVAMIGVAELAGELAESVSQWGRKLLACFVRTGAEDEAGRAVGAELEAALGRRRIARRFSAAEGAVPAGLVRLGLELDAKLVARLAPAVEDVDLLEPADDLGDVGELLERLGCKRLSPAEIARHLDLAQTDETYAGGLALLGAWLDTTGWQRAGVIQALRQRRVVQDETGEWRRPVDVEWRTDEAPALPVALRRLEVRVPPGGPARALLDALQIARLDPATALGRLLDALEAGTFARDEAERLETLDLASRIWRVRPDALAAESRRIGAIEVLVRTTRARVERSWRRAGSTYFGADWLDDRALEDLYGPLGVAEFLADVTPSVAAERRRRRDFYAALGVASAPRRVAIAWPHARHLEAWRNTDGRGAAWACANGHPQSPRKVDGWVMDRLDELLGQVNDVDSAAAFAHGVVLLGQPYGPETRVWCENSAHGGQAERKRTMGYQRWRLANNPWVPVANDPAGAVIEVPARAWRGLPARSPWLLVPRARLRPADAETLELVPAERPTPAAIEEALVALATAFPDLQAATPDVVNTADWLARRLERILVHGERRAASSPPLATQAGDGWRWSTEAVVPNLPGLPHLPGLDLLPPGRWSGLRRAYGLQAARDVVTSEWHAGRREVTPSLLPTDTKVLLLALLLRRGADSERTASRLARLSERPVAWLSLAWRYQGHRTEMPDARFVFEPKRDTRNRITRAELVWTANARPAPVELSEAIAEYLDLPDDDAEIALFLTASGRLVEQRGITDFEIGDADRLLRSRRWFRETREVVATSTPPPPDERLDPARWQEPPGAGAVAGGEQSGEREYIDPTTVTFGTPSQVSPPARPGRERRTKAVGGDAHPPRPPVANPLPPPAPEDVAAAAASGRRTEQTAIEIVARFGRGLPDVIEVIDVQDLDRGWDLEFRMKDGTTVPVEVKGSSGSGTFVLTSNEWEAARKNASYVLYHVVDVTTPSRTRMRVFRGLKDRLTEDLVAAAGWAVTGWRSLEPEEIPVLQARDDG